MREEERPPEGERGGTPNLYNLHAVRKPDPLYLCDEPITSTIYIQRYEHVEHHHWRHQTYIALKYPGEEAERV